MRILLLAPMPPDGGAPGAIPVVLDAQVRGLARSHEVVVATVAGPDERELEAVRRLRAEGIEVHAAVREAPVGGARSARRARRVGIWLRHRWPWRTVGFWTPEMQAIVDRLADRGDIDVISVEDGAMGVYRLPAGRPAVLTEYEVRSGRLAPGRPDRPGEVPRWVAQQVNWQRWSAYQRALWRRFDVVQAFTEQDAAFIGERRGDGGAPVRVNPFGIDLPAAADDALQEDGLVVLVGNYAHAPNVDAALWLGREIAPRLWRLHPRARIALAGPFAPESVRSLEGSRLQVLGAVDDLDDLTTRAAVVVAPVRVGGGMRMKVLHGMAMGKAIVTTTLGIQGLDCAGRVPPVVVADGRDAFAGAVAALLSDADRRRRLGRDARAFADRHHSPSAYADRLTEVYELAVGRAARRRAG